MRTVSKSTKSRGLQVLHLLRWFTHTHTSSFHVWLNAAYRCWIMLSFCGYSHQSVLLSNKTISLTNHFGVTWGHTRFHKPLNWGCFFKLLYGYHTIIHYYQHVSTYFPQFIHSVPVASTGFHVPGPSRPEPCASGIPPASAVGPRLGWCSRAAKWRHEPSQWPSAQVFLGISWARFQTEGKW